MSWNLKLQIKVQGKVKSFWHQGWMTVPRTFQPFYFSPIESGQTFPLRLSYRFTKRINLLEGPALFFCRLNRVQPPPPPPILADSAPSLSLNLSSLCIRGVCSLQTWILPFYFIERIMNSTFYLVDTVSFSDNEFVIGPCRSTATHDNDRKWEKTRGSRDQQHQ
jgi:hypothetical protein